MSLLTSLTRAWLTRSLRPFTFTKADGTAPLSFADCEGLGLYVHIPFCRQLCSFCPYCKERYVAQRCQTYIEHLIREIHMVGSSLTEKKRVTSLYFGGGSPALAAARIGDIVSAIEDHFILTEGIGIELHPDDVNVDTLTQLRTAGVNKISIGIQSFSDKYLSVLGRGAVDPQALSAALNQVPFDTVSMDFIFALPGQTAQDLQQDIDAAFACGANHVAIYPFIDFTFASAAIPPMGKAEKRRLLDAITQHCQARGYVRETIWTFSNTPGATYSSMTRDNFLGFGCSATTLLRDRFNINTFSVNDYQQRIERQALPTALTLRFTERQRMVYYLFWTAYSTKVDARAFERFFGVPLKRMYGWELWLGKRLGFVQAQGDVYRMTGKGAFYYHVYEQYYTLAYIDHMWGTLRREAFPEGICL